MTLSKNTCDIISDMLASEMKRLSNQEKAYLHAEEICPETKFPESREKDFNRLGMIVEAYKEFIGVE